MNVKVTQLNGPCRNGCKIILINWMQQNLAKLHWQTRSNSGKRLLDVVGGTVRSWPEKAAEDSRTPRRWRAIAHSSRSAANLGIKKTARKRLGVRLSSAAFLGAIKLSKPFIGRL